MITSPTISRRATVGVTHAPTARSDRWAAAALGLAVFLMDLRTVAPGLLVDDSAEFQTMVRLLGHTHPTGYEVYTLAARLFASVPLGEFTTRVSVFSAFMAGVTAGLVFLLVKELSASRSGGVVAAAVFAAAPTVWSQAVIAEVYTSAATLLAAILLLLVVWDRTGRRHWLMVAGLLGGLALGVHFTIGLLIPAVAVFLLVAGRAGRRSIRQVIVPAGAGALAGITLAVAAFVLVDVADPPAQYFDAVVVPAHSAWDLTPGEIDGLGARLRFDWTARQFGGLMFSRPGLAAEHWASFRSALPTELAPATLLVAVLGAVVLGRRRPPALLLIATAAATHLLFAFNYDIGGQIYVFYIPAYLLAAVLAGMGVGWLAETVGRLVPGRAAGWIAAVLAVGLLVWPVAAPNLPHVVNGTSPSFQFDSYPYDDFVASGLGSVVEATVADLPPDAILFTDWEVLYPHFYVAHVLHGRTDLMFHETFPADDQEGLADSTVRYIVEQARHRPVFVPERFEELAEAGVGFSPLRLGGTVAFKVTP